MNSLFGITNIKVYVAQTLGGVNDFIARHDGNIISVQGVLDGGYIKFVITYKEG